MNQQVSPPQSTDAVSGRTMMLPDAPLCVLSAGKIQWLTREGEIRTMDADSFAQAVRHEMPILCHAPYIASKMGLEPFLAYDVLELFAFTHPGTFALPTPAGLAKALGFFIPDGAEGDPVILLNIVRHLLQDLIAMDLAHQPSDPIAAACVMAMGQRGLTSRQGWPWAAPVLAALGTPNGYARESMARAGIQIWHKMSEWNDSAGEPPPAHKGVSPDEAVVQLTQLLDQKGQTPRDPQIEYTRDLTKAFQPMNKEEEPHTIIAEAGTGIGKTLGYLAPSTVWADKNDGAVWISTYTRNLQRQIDGELDRLFSDPLEKQRRVVVRKGRENYLCLLNLEDATNSPSLQHNVQNAVAVGLMARWAAVSCDGDLTGGDFPGWLVSLLGWGRTYGLSDRRGECIYGACNHYSKCFIEKSKRRAKKADIVVANHALVMIQAALAGPQDQLPNRYVFDEGHHVFEAADSAFAVHLSGVETADLRRWILGAESGNRSRARGLSRRLAELVEQDESAAHLLEDIQHAARALPGQGWRLRLKDEKPRGVTENFLALVRQQVYARASDRDAPYSIETETLPLNPGMFEAAYALSLKLNDIKRPMEALIKRLRARLEDPEQFELLSTEEKQKIESVTQSLKRRSSHLLDGWIRMLQRLNDETPEHFVDWFGVDRIEGRDYDIGMFRHWVDPTEPFAESFRPYAHGVVMTSASLRDNTDNPENDWKVAEDRTGLTRLAAPANPPVRTVKSSPFDYIENTRILVVRDVPKNDVKQVAAAYRALNFAAQGGTLNLFTSIRRQREVYERIAPDMEDAGYSLYAQHLDGLHVSTLIDMFRDDEDAVLFGTDATRDGMDVPGNSLRMIVFDRVPWPRPNILHKARRKAFGRGYDDLLIRARLKQAYGRLIRQKGDRGLFVVLDPMLPSRLCTAFPEGVEVERIGLADAVTIVKDFYKA